MVIRRKGVKHGFNVDWLDQLRIGPKSVGLGSAQYQSTSDWPIQPNLRSDWINPDPNPEI